jgi:acyl-coenzyme A synthetase/AMP-(fatty) acid ligase
LNNNSSIFSVDASSCLQVRPDTPLSSQYPKWLAESLDFAEQCIPPMAAGTGPVVLSGLPIDFSLALAVAAWYSGRVVAFVDPAVSMRQQHAVESTLKPALWVSAAALNTPLVGDTAHLPIDDGSEDQNSIFEQWLCTDAARPPAYTWAADEPAIVLFTSGSTGLPKGVCHSLQNLIHSAHLFQQHFDISQKDQLLNLAPLSTMSGLRCSMFLPLLAGCDVNLEPVPGQLASMLRVLGEQNGSVLIVGPALLQALAGIDHDIPELKTLRVILSTGAGLSREVRQALWQKHSIPILDYYGLTETCGLVIAERLNAYNPKQTALGKSCAGVRACVVDEQGNEFCHGRGQLRIYGAALFLGYWGQALNRREHFDTRDQVDIDQSGWINYLGRLDRAVKSAATTWLQPQAVEQWLVDHTSIEDFAVTTSQCRQGGRIQCYFVGLITLCKQTLLKNLVDELGRDYQTTQWLQVESIPRTPLGKIKWVELEQNEKPE